ncbi:intermembrane phospholipid transport protein YdbH family protein [Caulobacter sp. DWR1-3-2b1]|uniref:intermembrane phospholipid transport protein YdbH family protein n=1 Tax=Caulobacter sp. DWR1-3-2b1 TaxID=2804670 RepID=UPI003CE8CF9D
MDEPTPDPAPPTRSAVRRASSRHGRLIDAGLEAVSLSMLGFIAVGLLVHGGRREISRELAQGWLRERGIDAVVVIDDLDASGFSGSILLGPKSDPVFAAERIEVAYDLTTPWTKGLGNGNGFAIDTRAVRLVRPRIKASLTEQGGLNFGPLQPLIDEALASPKDPKVTGPAILVENARLDLRTPGGLARITGDASLDDGKLLRFDGRLARMRYATGDLVVEARGALLSARKRGQRLTVAARFDLDALVGQDLELDDAQGQVDADIAYPDLAKLSATGPAEVRLALKAASARMGATQASDAAASLALIGALDGTLTQGRFDGRVVGTARGDTLQAPGLNARDIGLDLDLGHVAASKLGEKIAVQARGHVQAEAGQALAGGAALRDASARLDMTSLILSADKAGAAVSGPLAVQLGASRLASGSLALNSLALAAKGRVAGPLNNPILTLKGSAGADSGVSAPDAERLAAVLPDPADARAAAQALRTFDLRAPAFDLTLRDGRTILALPRPITLTAANGVRAGVAAPRGPLMDAIAGQMRGGLVADLSGGGLPTLRLEAPDWRMEDGALNSRLAITGEGIDYAPLEGLAGRIEGVARMAGSRFSFALAGCQPLTAKRVMIGETPLSAPKVVVCPGAGPLLAINDGAWTAAARFSDLTLSLDEAEAAVEGGAGSLTASGAGGLPRAEVRLDQGLLRDAAETRRFNPIKAAGRLSLSNGLWSCAIDATTPVGQPLGRIVLRHDVARARGRAELDASRLAFVKDGLQPGDLSPMAAWATQASGPASFTGLFAWDADGMKSNGRLVASKLDFTSPIGFVATLDGTIDFTSLTPLVSAPDQSLKIVRIDSIVPLQGFAAAFSLGAESLHISSAAFEAAKGRISIEPTEVPLDPEKPIRGVIVVEHLDLGELIAASSLVEKIQLDAVVDGRLPFELSAKGFRFLDGKVRAIKPGRLAISRAALTGVQAGVQGKDSDSPGAPAPPPSPAAPVNAIQDFAYQAMENLSFDTLEAGVNSTDQGRLAILFHIKGEHDPKVSEKARISLLDLIRGSAFNKRIALPAKTPVELTLDTSLNFDELLQAWRRAYKGEDPSLSQDGASRSAPVQP